MTHDRLHAVEFLLSETDPGRLGACAAEIAFVGRSNVGKSTLLNAVCRKALARVPADALHAAQKKAAPR